ncbi:MAG: MATE family efflux transporter [Schleiferiaceae bacterium]
MRFWNRIQWRQNAPLALPVVAGQVGHIAASVADSVMVGRLGTVPLAAVSLANSILSVPLVFGIGMAYGLTPLVAHAHGQRRSAKGQQLFKNALAVNLAAALLMTLMAFALAWGAEQTGQDPRVLEAYRPYFLVVSLSYIPFMLFMAGKQYLEGMGETQIPMRLSLIGNSLNVVLNALLIYGWLGFPEWGMTGAGIATLIARLYMAAGMYWFLVRKGRINAEVWTAARVTVHRVWALLKLGVPTGFQYIFEVSAFAISAWIIGTYGATALAAHQVAISLASISYMAATGLGAAATIRIGQYLGQRDHRAAREAATSLFGLTVLFMTFTGLLFLVGRNVFPFLYTDSAEVAQLAGQLLVVAALFQISDGMQATALGALRGIQDVKMPTLFTFIAYYVFALPLEWVIGTYFDGGAVGVWIALAVGLTVAAGAMTVRFYQRLAVLAK